MVNSVYTSGFKHPCSLGGGGWRGGAKRKRRHAVQKVPVRQFSVIITTSVLFPFMNIFSCISMQSNFFDSVVRPFQDYFSSYVTGQSVGGAKTGVPLETPDTPASRTWLVSRGQCGARTHTRHSSESKVIVCNELH